MTDVPYAKWVGRHQRMLIGGEWLPPGGGRATAYPAGFRQFPAEECKRIGGRTTPASSPSKRLLTLRHPIGVAAAITIWNFPAAAITRPVAPALAAGCTDAAKPDEGTPLRAIAVCEALQERGLP